MRDAGRLRERIELSLDDRQVIALGTCALLLLGGVFSVGILRGKRLSAAAPPASQGDLAALDAQARKEQRPQPPAARPLEVPQRDEQVRVASLVPAPPREPTVVPAPPRPTQIPPPAAVLTPPPRDLGAFTVQVGASRDRTEAARIEARARGAGLKPYVVEANLGAKGTWYRVRVGSFSGRDSANRFRTDVERELRAAAVVMPTR